MTATVKFLLAALLAATALLGLSLFRADAKKPSFRNSTWVCVQEEFLADVGTTTRTFTLRFLSGRKCILQREWDIPAHASMRMNTDGTVDTIPGSRSTAEDKGTWKFRNNELTITLEDGSTMTLVYMAQDKLMSRNGTYTRQIATDQ